MWLWSVITTVRRLRRIFKYAVKCIRSSKRPKVQVWGGDIKTDKEVITSRTSNNVNVPDENLSRIELDKTSIRSKRVMGYRIR